MADNIPGYSTTLPVGEGTVSGYSGQPIYPLITSNITGAIPTNDWWSSLVFSYFNGSYSGSMFAAPLGMHTTASGLDIGYTPLSRIIMNEMGQQVKYEYSYHTDLKLD